MTRALSPDLRRHAIATVGSGMTRRAAAVRFGVSASSVIRLVAEWQARWGGWPPCGMNVP